MGIKQLFSIIKDEAPEAIKEGEIKNQFGRKVAIVRSIYYPIPPVSAFCR
jgi:flap endonuclease-1